MTHFLCVTYFQTKFSKQFFKLFFPKIFLQTFCPKIVKFGKVFVVLKFLGFPTIF